MNAPRQTTKWDQRFMQLAKLVATWSKDRSTKVGCVIVGSDNEVRSIGFNGFPRFVDDDVEERHARPAKYAWTEHAERNAIYSAVRIGVALKDCTMYLPWFPCMDCARAIVQSGISRLVAFEPNLDDPRWGEDFRSAIVLLEEAGVALQWFSEEQIVGEPIADASTPTISAVTPFTDRNSTEH